jgi:hypothetical protein
MRSLGVWENNESTDYVRPGSHLLHMQNQYVSTSDGVHTSDVILSVFKNIYSVR